MMGISSPKMRTQVSQIECPQESGHSGLRRKHHRQVVLLLSCVYGMQTLPAFSRCRCAALLPDNVMFKKASIKRFFRYRACSLASSSARSSVMN